MAVLVIHLNNMRLMAKLGYYPHEMEKPREVIAQLSITLVSDLACQSDGLEDTVDYDLIVTRFQETALEKHHKLIEHLAHRLLESLSGFALISRARLELEKPDSAPQCDAAGVVIERSFR